MSHEDNHTRKTHHYYALPTASITHCLLPLLCIANCQYHVLLTAIMHCQLPVSRIAYCHYYALPTASITHCLLPLLCIANCQYHALLTAIMHCQLPVSRIAYCYYAMPTAALLTATIMQCSQSVEETLPFTYQQLSLFLCCTESRVLQTQGGWCLGLL